MEPERRGCPSDLPFSCCSSWQPRLARLGPDPLPGCGRMALTLRTQGGRGLGAACHRTPSWVRWGPWGEEKPPAQGGPHTPPACLPLPRQTGLRETGTRAGPTGDGNGVGHRWDPRAPVLGPCRHPRFPRRVRSCAHSLPPGLPGAPPPPEAWHCALKAQKGWTLPPRADHTGGPGGGPLEREGPSGPPGQLRVWGFRLGGGAAAGGRGHL